MNKDPFQRVPSPNSVTMTTHSKSTLDYSKPESVSTMKSWTHAELGIPRSIKILSHTIDIVIVDTSDLDRFGDSDFATNTIRLFPSGCKRDVIRHTYWHEVTHFLLHYAGYPELCSDEVLVDVLGGLLTQVVACPPDTQTSTNDTD